MLGCIISQVLHSAANTMQNTRTQEHTQHQTVTSLVLPPPPPYARLGGMDAVSELMEQGEHRLAVNRRRWRRDQGALEAPLCIRTTAGYCHRVFWGRGVIFSGESSPASLHRRRSLWTVWTATEGSPPFVYMRLHAHTSTHCRKYAAKSDLCANDTNVPKSPLKNICGSITIKIFCL